MQRPERKGVPVGLAGLQGLRVLVQRPDRREALLGKTQERPEVQNCSETKG